MHYENEKAKPTHYLIQIVDYDDLYGQRQEWAPKLWELTTDPTWDFLTSIINVGH